MTMQLKPSEETLLSWSADRDDLPLRSPDRRCTRRSGVNSRPMLGRSVPQLRPHPSQGGWAVSPITDDVEFAINLSGAAFEVSPAGVISAPLETPRVRTIGCMFVQGSQPPIVATDRIKSDANNKQKPLRAEAAGPTLAPLLNCWPRVAHEFARRATSLNWKTGCDFCCNRRWRHCYQRVRCGLRSRRSTFNWMALRFCIPGIERCWPTKWA